MPALSLRAALTHGAIVAVANWPVVLIHFALDSFFRTALALPILGGALMVAAVAGTEPGAVVGEGLQGTAELVIAALAATPSGLASFFIALGIVGIGGQSIVIAYRIGTLSVVAASESRAREAYEAHELPIGAELLQRASAFSLQAVYDGVRHFARRGLTLALWLGALYVVVGGTYLLAVSYGLSMAVRVAAMVAWPLLVFAATAVGVVAIAVVNLVYDLLQVIVVTDDCSIRRAMRELRRFVVEDSRQVIGIFAVMTALGIVATAASVLAAAGLAVAAWTPLVGLVVVPIQAAAWVVRGLILQFMALVALAAYQTQYRRFAEARRTRIVRTP